MCDRNQPKWTVKAALRALARPTLDTDTLTTARKTRGSHSGRLTARSGLGADRRGAVLDADHALYAAKAAGRNRTEVVARFS